MVDATLNAEGNLKREPLILRLWQDSVVSVWLMGFRDGRFCYYPQIAGLSVDSKGMFTFTFPLPLVLFLPEEK